MAKLEELTFDIKAKMCVDRETAELCLKMAEIYCNASGVVIVGEKDPYQVGGDVHYYFHRED